MATLRLNGEQIEADEGRNLLMVALERGVFIPHLCFHPGLSAPAHCRMCLAEVEVNGHRELTTTCNAKVADGMTVDASSDAVEQAREAVLEFLLLNHPLDCPVCDKAGECELQNYAFTNGRHAGRYEEPKRRQSTRDIGEHILLDPERCIRCSRCVRFCEEVSGSGELGVFHKGGRTEVDVFDGQRVDDLMSGNLVDLCPVGAMLDKGFRRQPVWRLDGVDSVCPGCASGCNIRIDVRDNRIRRLKPRVNMKVNEHWMCDEGRYGWGYVHDEMRLTVPMVAGPQGLARASWDEALAAAHEGMKPPGAVDDRGSVVVLGGHMTNEEAYLLGLLATDVWGIRRAYLQTHISDAGDIVFPGGFTIRADRSPNSHGVREVTSHLGLEVLQMEEIRAAIDAGEIRAAWVAGGGPSLRLSDDAMAALDGLEFLVVQDILESDLTAAANVVLPGCSFAEKDGTFTNCDGRVQRIRRAVEPPGEAIPDWHLLSKLGEAAGQAVKFGFENAGEVLAHLGESISAPPLKGASYEALDAGEPARYSTGQAYGGGWSALMQRLGFLQVEDHTKTCDHTKNA